MSGTSPSPATSPNPWGRALANLANLAAGTVFGLGLAVTQMVDPRKVLAFLDVTGAWDASLLFVLGAAVAVAFVGLRWPHPHATPRWDAVYHPPTSTAVDRALVIGSALFGIGWGLAGYCPGPAMASIAFGNAEALWFVPAMLAGAALQRHFSRKQTGPG